MLLKPAVPRFDIENGFAKILMIGDGCVNCVHSALAHLAEDFFRPIGILQIVNEMMGHDFSCGGREAYSMPSSSRTLRATRKHSSDWGTPQ